MTTNTSTTMRTEVMPPNGRIFLPTGNFFFLISAGAPVNVRFYRGGSEAATANGATSGYKLGLLPDNSWDRAFMDGTPGASITYLCGHVELLEEFTDFDPAQTSFAPVLPQSVADAADVDVGASPVAIQVAAANAARRRVTVKLTDASAVNVRVGFSTVTAARGLQLTPGQSKDFEGPYAVFAIREAVGAAVMTMCEEVN
jgi:hypothetical protein